MLKWLISLFKPAEGDPVRDCSMYRDKANGSCAHIDGMLCVLSTCKLKQLHEQHGPNAKYDQWHRNILDNGMVLLQDRPTFAADLRTGELFEPDREGGWKLARKLTPSEIIQAEDQRDYGIIH